MGYRLYIGKVDKAEHDKMQKMSVTYLKEKYGDDECVSVYDLAKELYNFGKYYEVDTKNYNHFFASPELQEYFSDYDFWIVDKEFLLGIIEKERANIEQWYTENKEKPLEELVAIQESRRREWSTEFCLPYSLDLEKPEVVSSWQREYVLFELVRIYKTFDWEKDLLVYYGW